MAASLEQRMNESRDSNGVYFNRVMGALLAHAAYQRRSDTSAPGVTEPKRAFALTVLFNPSNYVFTFAARISVEPATNSYDTMHDVPAETIIGQVETYFGDYVTQG